MNIILSEQAKSEMMDYLSDAKGLRLSLIDGCCGKSFALEKIAVAGSDDESAIVDDLLFVMPKSDALIVGDVTIDSPGPLDGFMITPKNATGGCGCGRSFFIETEN